MSFARADFLLTGQRLKNGGQAACSFLFLKLKKIIFLDFNKL
jgi:hypothetical protein